MGMEGNQETIFSDDHDHNTLVDNKKSNNKLTLFPLIALIFYEVSGGPFGVEDSVRVGGGALLSLLGFIIFPIFWSIPEALVTAELATSFPKNGGYVLWISSAFGPFWGFQEGFWKWFSGVMDNTLYPVLFLDYLKHSLPIFDEMYARIPALIAITILLTYLNYRGLHIVGTSAIFLAGFSLLPFVVMGLLSIPKIRPKRWVSVDFKKVEWRGYFNIMFWNLDYWDKASTLAGEVQDPSKIFPKALCGGVILVICSYLIPLLAGTGSLDTDSSKWSDGYFAEVGMLIGGSWLKRWIQVAAALSNLGLFEAEMSSHTFQLLGMSEIGMIPAVFASRSKFGTPTISILCSATGVIFFSWMSFQEILEFLNFVYALGMLLEFAAFIKLRIKKPDLHRPYKVPLKTFSATMLCVPPSILLVLVMCLATARTFIVSGIVVVFGFILYPAIIHAKNKKWVHFLSNDVTNSCDRDVEDQDNKMVHMTDEVEVSLLLDTSSPKTDKLYEILPERLSKLE